jgi:hypothetical protein
MAVDISTAVTNVWPRTESILTGGDGVSEYEAAKAAAIARAKRALYGTATVPSEDDIPEVVADWIVDQAVVYLIPLAQDYYMTKRRVSDSKEGANITYYNILQQLDRLRGELEASLAANKQAALEAISSSTVDDAVPQVSTDGLAVDPLARAMTRGPW